ncbi:MAG: adenylate/guanylate cyclase domain-containing protein [Chloroflexi bacterium]|nr:adenylate/guanylate cyclase domain-containing protein [Chloroflexota bacterium]
MAVPDTKYVITSDGVHLAYQVVGDGPVDVAVGFHYFGSNVDLIWDEPDWRPFLVAFADFSRMIVHDRRGLGVSSRNVPPPNLETQVSDLLTVLDAAGSQRPILVSGGLSSAVHVLFAAMHPDRVSGLIWSNPTARAAWAPDYPWGETNDEYLESLGRRPGSWGTFAQAQAIADMRARERLGLRHDAEAPHQRPELVNNYARIIRNSASPDVATEIYRINYETDIRAALPLVQAPVSLITGTDDEVDETRYVASLLPNATVHVIDGRAGLALEPLLRVFHKMTGVTGSVSSIETVLATVLFTDIVGSTAQQAALGDRAWKDLVERHHHIVRSALLRWRGTERDTAGDGFFATVDGAARAIRCAQEIAEAVREIGLTIRAGVHVGECEIIDGGVGGITVTIGARIAARAGASEVLISQTVKDLVAGSGFGYEDTGEHELKGVPGLWRIWSVLPRAGG